MQVIDTKGKLCPAPLIMTKRAIKNGDKGSEIKVLCDNETAKSNLLDYITELGFSPVCKEVKNVFEIVFKIENISQKETAINDFCNGNGYTVVIKSKRMGDGDQQLGEMLMRAFINSLIECDVPPKNIVIYNEGVFVALKGIDTEKTLQTLSDKGVSITICGTCVDYYNVKERLSVGEISNMYKITEILSQSSNIIYP